MCVPLRINFPLIEHGHLSEASEFLGDSLKVDSPPETHCRALSSEPANAGACPRAYLSVLGQEDALHAEDRAADLKRRLDFRARVVSGQDPLAGDLAPEFPELFS